MGEPRLDQAWLVRVLAALVVVPIGLTIWLTDWSSLLRDAWSAGPPSWPLFMIVAVAGFQVIASSPRWARPSLALGPGELRGHLPLLTALLPLVWWCQVLPLMVFPSAVAPVWLVLGLLWLTIAVVAIAWPRSVVISARGVAVRRFPGRLEEVAWERIEHARAQMPRAAAPGLAARWVELRLTAGSGRPIRQLPANTVEARFLADVIEYYRLHPEERSGIGTLDGYHRMTAALTDWYRAQPAVRR